MHLDIKEENQISLNIIDHLTWFKLHWNKHGRTFHKHSIAWRKKVFENLLGFEAIVATVVYWVIQVQTDGLCALDWWILEASQLNDAWELPNLILPLLELEENRARKGFTVGKWRFKEVPNVVQMKEWWRKLAVFWGFVQKFTKCQNARWEKMDVFGRVAALSRVQHAEK